MVGGLVERLGFVRFSSPEGAEGGASVDVRSRVGCRGLSTAAVLMGGIVVCGTLERLRGTSEERLGGF